MGKCKFSDNWLHLKDCNGQNISEWCKKKGDFEAVCILCNMIICVEKGFYALKRHSEGAKHKVNVQQNCKQLTLQPGTIRLYSIKDAAYTAELIWCLKMIANNLPIQSCKDIVNVFKTMFPDAVPSSFSLNPTKASYLISDALAPYFRDLFLKEARLSKYTLQFDETTNAGGFKELQTRVRYWSDASAKVVSRHLETFFMGHAKAEDIQEKLVCALNNGGLPPSNLLMLSCDGPNVNKKVLSLMEEEVKSITQSTIVKIGFCNLHVLHNAFLKGLSAFGMNSSDLVISLYHYFDGWPARRQDFSKILGHKKMKDLHFIKHVNSRWLSLEPAVNRVLELWDGIIEYFLKFIPSKESKTMERASYKKIVSLLKIKTMRAELKFVCISSAIFSHFTGFFQKEEPLIHVMHERLKDLLQKLTGRICKINSIKNFKNGLISSSDIFEETHLLNMNDIPLGEHIEDQLKDCTESCRKDFRLSIQKHYVAAGKYVIKKSLLGNALLKSVSCIKPDAIKKSISVRKIQEVASQLPFSTKCEELIDEWKLLQCEVLENEPIEMFWNKVFMLKGVDGSMKYKNLKKVVSSVLSFAHGSADIERGFSKSQRTMSEDRASMSARSLNAQLTVSDALKLYENKPERVPITGTLLSLARSAYKSYDSYLENEREKVKTQTDLEKTQQKEDNDREEKAKMYAESKKDILVSALEKKLKEVQSEVYDSTKTSDKLLEEGNKRLQNALNKNNLTEAKIAQVLINGALMSKEECKNKQKNISMLDRQLHKRKDSVITSFFSKKPRN